MESLGDKFKNTRNNKGLSLDQVSHETNISIRYLEAMETENFSVFPSEPYVVGFLRNYSEYLELDVQKVVALYRALRIQEQPVPVDKLIKPPVNIKGVFLVIGIILLILIILGAAGWGVYNLILSNRDRVVQEVPKARTPVEYVMEGNLMERRLYRSDSVLVTIDYETYKIELYNLGETVTIRTPAESRSMDLGQEITIDLNNDGISELRITVVDFAKNDPDMGALIYFLLTDAAVYSGADINYNAAGSASAASSATIIPSSVSAYPFTLQVNFQGYCMFRWEILSEPARQGTTQRYFQRGESLDIQAQNLGMRIWLSNAQAARFQVIGGGRTYPVDIGLAGEVVVAEIRWVRDEDNRSRLILIRLES